MAMIELFQKAVSRIHDIFETQYRHYCFKKAIASGFLIMGKHSYGMPKVEVYRGSEAKVVVGSYCSIGPDVTFLTGGIHPIEWVSTYPFRAQWRMEGAEKDGMPSTRGDITIGNDVWIGTHVLVLSGVNVGHGAVICSGSVVTRDVPPYTISGGVPAKPIKKRFRDEEIMKLLEIRWWEWNEDKIIRYVHLLSSPRVVQFIEEAKNNGKT